MGAAILGYLVLFQFKSLMSSYSFFSKKETLTYKSLKSNIEVYMVNNNIFNTDAHTHTPYIHTPLQIRQNNITHNIMRLITYIVTLCTTTVDPNYGLL